MTLIDLSDIVTDFEKRFAETPVRAVVGSQVWYTAVQHFHGKPVPRLSLLGLTITLDPVMQPDAIDVYLANGHCRRYVIKRE
jgi:hypothetical protein